MKKAIKWTLRVLGILLLLASFVEITVQQNPEEEEQEEDILL